MSSVSLGLRGSGGGIYNTTVFTVLLSKEECCRFPNKGACEGRLREDLPSSNGFLNLVCNLKMLLTRCFKDFNVFKDKTYKSWMKLKY